MPDTEPSPDSGDMTSFGQWMLTRRDVQGMRSWAEMATQGGIAESSLKTLLKKQFRVTPRPETLRKLAKAADTGEERVMLEVMKVMRPDVSSGAPVGYKVDDLVDGLPDEDIALLRSQARGLRRARGLDT